MLKKVSRNDERIRRHLRVRRKVSGTPECPRLNVFRSNKFIYANNTWKQILKESVVALINATIISMLVYIYNFIRFGATATVSYSVSLSLFAVVMFASIFGTLVPMTLEKLKIDPAIATGPFISITNDIIGMLLYMGITVLLA